MTDLQFWPYTHYDTAPGRAPKSGRLSRLAFTSVLTAATFLFPKASFAADNPPPPKPAAAPDTAQPNADTTFVRTFPMDGHTYNLFLKPDGKLLFKVINEDAPDPEKPEIIRGTYSKKAGVSVLVTAPERDPEDGLSLTQYKSRSEKRGKATFHTQMANHATSSEEIVGPTRDIEKTGSIALQMVADTLSGDAKKLDKTKTKKKRSPTNPTLPVRIIEHVSAIAWHAALVPAHVAMVPINAVRMAARPKHDTKQPNAQEVEMVSKVVTVHQPREVLEDVITTAFTGQPVVHPTPAPVTAAAPLVATETPLPAPVPAEKAAPIRTAQQANDPFHAENDNSAPPELPIYTLPRIYPALLLPPIEIETPAPVKTIATATPKHHHHRATVETAAAEITPQPAGPEQLPPQEGHKFTANPNDRALNSDAFALVGFGVAGWALRRRGQLNSDIPAIYPDLHIASDGQQMALHHPHTVTALHVMSWVKQHAPEMLANVGTGAAVRAALPVVAKFALAKIVFGASVAAVAASPFGVVAGAIAASVVAKGLTSVAMTYAFHKEELQHKNWKSQAFKKAFNFGISGKKGYALGVASIVAGVGITDYFSDGGVLHGLFHGNSAAAASAHSIATSVPDHSAVTQHVQHVVAAAPVFDIHSLLSVDQFKELTPDVQKLATSQNPRDIIMFCQSAASQIINGHHGTAGMEAVGKLMQHGLDVAKDNNVHGLIVQQLHANMAYAEAWGKLGVEQNVTAALEHAKLAGDANNGYGARLISLLGKHVAKVAPAPV